MPVWMMTSLGDLQDLYCVLQVSQTASSEEIKKSYQRLVREYHPDKLSPELSDEERATAVEKFHQLSKAYEVLSDETQRCVYDTNTNAAGLTQKWPISDTVDLDEMTFNPEEDTFSLACRCGGSYIISEAEMEEGVDIVSCCTCTLSIKVLYQDTRDDEQSRKD